MRPCSNTLPICDTARVLFATVVPLDNTMLSANALGIRSLLQLLTYELGTINLRNLFFGQVS